MSDNNAENHSCQSCQSSGSKLRCAKCKVSYYCNTDCQKNNWPVHINRCKFLQNHPPTTDAEPKSIPGVIIEGGATRYANTTVPTTHPIFNTRALPITMKFKWPLVMHRKVNGLPRGTATKNQHATYLNIDPQNGFAPEYWQGGIGDVIVANADGTPLNHKVLGAIVDYVSGILDAFGDGEGPPTSMYNRARLDEAIEHSLENQYDSVEDMQRKWDDIRARGLLTHSELEERARVSGEVGRK